MRRTVALWLVISSLAGGCAAGLAAPAAFAAGGGGTATTGVVPNSTATLTQPSFSLSNAQQNAVTTAPAPVVPVTTASTSNGGLSGSGAVIIAIVAALVLGGIAYFVWRDARGHAARVSHGGREDPLFGQRAHSGSKAPRKQRKLKPAERKRRRRGRAR